MFAVSKAADLNQLVQGGQLYWAIPFNKGSLAPLFQVLEFESSYPYSLHKEEYCKNILIGFTTVVEHSPYRPKAWVGKLTEVVGSVRLASLY